MHKRNVWTVDVAAVTDITSPAVSPVQRRTTSMPYHLD